ncbi:hypothetical protein GJ633_04085 [Halorubrum sp. CBA1125]|uniref:hypothetical protein n=1 Tax=Halorubrum sp. CBA1125 TaxID=2668072 RepID=UPI0012E9008F|nr:hypothetical protein [Halorubrum sp. CBA1125]MUW13931.1 hypothetical protein [Halorubrum sp. CBA1125]
MTEAYISLYGNKAESFERVKEEFGPEGVDLSNADVVMRLIEEYEEDKGEIRGGLMQ